MRAAPRRSEIPPVGAVPVPVARLVDLALHGVGEGASAEAERGVGHTERAIDLVAEEIGQRRSETRRTISPASSTPMLWYFTFVPGKKSSGVAQVAATKS